MAKICEVPIDRVQLGCDQIVKYSPLVKTTVGQVRKDLEARFALRDGALKPHMSELLPLLEKSLATHGKAVPADPPKGETVRVSAFVLFARECAQEIKKEFAHLDKAGKAAKLRERWGALPPVKRAPYETEIARRTAESKHTDSLGKRYAVLKRMVEHRDQVEAMKAPAAPSKNSAGVALTKEEKQYKVLKAMATACGFGPHLQRGLKNMDRAEAVKVFRERLLEAGAEFSGPLPTKAEVEAARKKTELRKSLEGIDMSNIVRGQKRRSVGRETGGDPAAKVARKARKQAQPDREETLSD